MNKIQSYYNWKIIPDDFDNIFLQTNEENYDIQNIYDNGIVILKNTNEQQELIAKLKNNEVLYYTLGGSQREKIIQQNLYLGYKKDINNLIFEHDMKWDLKHNEEFKIYNCDDNRTKISCCVEQNEEIVVGRFIRFPSIDKKVYNSTNFPSYSGEEIAQGVNVISTSNGFSYEVNGEKKSTIHKIIGYEDDTGEIRFENELEDVIKRDDTYEIWEQVVVSGQPDNKYYTRRYPIPELLPTAEGGTVTIVSDPYLYGLCLSNNEEEVFLQQNINMQSDAFYNPQLRIVEKEIIFLMMTKTGRLIAF